MKIFQSCLIDFNNKTENTYIHNNIDTYNHTIVKCVMIDFLQNCK